MATYTIDQENNITAWASTKEAKSHPKSECFVTAQEMLRLAAKWPANRLVDIWNTLPGQTPVKRFTSRKKAVTRIWRAIQKLDASVGAPATRVPPKKVRLPQNAARSRKPVTVRDGSKKTQILTLLRREGGATLDDLMAATGWQAHSVRGFISGALGKKMGLAVESSKRETGERVYALKNN